MLAGIQVHSRALTLAEADPNRYLDPDPGLILEEAARDTNPKFHNLNRAVVELVRLPLFPYAVVSIQGFVWHPCPSYGGVMALGAVDATGFFWACGGMVALRVGMDLTQDR